MTDTTTYTRVDTRVDTYTRVYTEEGDREVIWLFEKRKLVGEFDIDDISRDDWEETLPEFIANTKAGKPRATPVKLTEVLDFLSAEVNADEEDDEAPASIVPAEYRIRYGSEQNCGDTVAVVLTAYVTTGRINKKDPEAGLDRAKLRGVAELNGIGDKLGEWENRGLNGGLLRMNTSNVLRGIVRRGEQVVIGDTIWEADPSKLAARLERRKAARKANKAARAAKTPKA